MPAELDQMKESERKQQTRVPSLGQGCEDGGGKWQLYTRRSLLGCANDENCKERNVE